MNEQKSSPNYFVRIGIIAVVLYICYLVCSSFLLGPDPHVITNGIIVLLTMIILLVLAESFNSISFGSILGLKRDVQKAEDEKQEAKSEVRELRTTLLSMATNVHQSQVTTNISGLDVPTLRRVLGIAEASPEDKAKSKDVEEEKSAPLSPTPDVTQKVDYEAGRKLRARLENELFERFSSKYNIPGLEIRREVKIESGLEISDPIMDRPIIYDGYVRSSGKEYFIEVSTSSSLGMSGVMADRLYVALAKVLFYRQIKKVDAELVFIYSILPDTVELQGRTPVTRILQWFQPAISNGLLRAEGFTFSQEEVDALKKKTQSPTRR
jgi:hypothetical protein